MNGLTIEMKQQTVCVCVCVSVCVCVCECVCRSLKVPFQHFLLFLHFHNHVGCLCLQLYPVRSLPPILSLSLVGCELRVNGLKTFPLVSQFQTRHTNGTHKLLEVFAPPPSPAGACQQVNRAFGSEEVKVNVFSAAGWARRTEILKRGKNRGVFSGRLLIFFKSFEFFVNWLFSLQNKVS